MDDDHADADRGSEFDGTNSNCIGIDDEACLRGGSGFSLFVFLSA